MSRRIITIILCFTLLCEQSGFAQGLAQLNLSARFVPAVARDKFRPMHLRSLEYVSVNEDFRIFMDKGDETGVNFKTQNAKLQEETKKVMEYFFVGLILPNSVFWVNLRPDGQDKIIEPTLANTDLGKVLLEADVQLKKDVAGLTSPETTTGRAYWDKLYAKAEELFGSEQVDIPTYTRPWIVPGEIVVGENAGRGYIYKATLAVMLEEDYVRGTCVGAGSKPALQGRAGLEPAPTIGGPADPRYKALNEYSSQLIRELIIPQITKEVNSSRRYAELRQVYYSLILAQWFKGKHRSGVHPSSVVPHPSSLERIDSGDLNGLTSKVPWSKEEYFNQYKRSFEKGEYDIRQTHDSVTGQTIRRYVSGGILLAEGISSAISQKPITPARFPEPGGEYPYLNGGKVSGGPLDMAVSLNQGSSSVGLGEFGLTSKIFQRTPKNIIERIKDFIQDSGHADWIEAFDKLREFFKEKFYYPIYYRLCSQVEFNQIWDEMRQERWNDSVSEEEWKTFYHFIRYNRRVNVPENMMAVMVNLLELYIKSLSFIYNSKYGLSKYVELSIYYSLKRNPHLKLDIQHIRDLLFAHLEKEEEYESRPNPLVLFTKQFPKIFAPAAAEYLKEKAHYNVMRALLNEGVMLDHYMKDSLEKRILETIPENIFLAGIKNYKYPWRKLEYEYHQSLFAGEQNDRLMHAMNIKAVIARKYLSLWYRSRIDWWVPPYFSTIHNRSKSEIDRIPGYLGTYLENTKDKESAAKFNILVAINKLALPEYLKVVRKRGFLYVYQHPIEAYKEYCEGIQASSGVEAKVIKKDISDSNSSSSSVTEEWEFKTEDIIKGNERALRMFNGYLHANYGAEVFMLDEDQVFNDVPKIAADPNYEPKDMDRSILILLRGIFVRLSGKNPTLSSEEKRVIRSLGRTFKNFFLMIHPKDKITTREMVWFNKVLSRYYLRDRDNAVANIFKWFFLTACTVYGRFITRDKRVGFTRILNDIISNETSQNNRDGINYHQFFAKSIAALGENITPAMIEEIMDYGTFEEPIPDNIKLPTQRKIWAAMERARVCMKPLFLFLPKDHFRDVVVKTLEADEKNIVFPVSLSGFTALSEFQGRNLPADHVVEWFDGIFARLIKFAEENPDKRIYLVLENTDFLPGDVRLALHSYLLERKVIVQERGPDGRKQQARERKLPGNLHTVLPIFENVDIGDQSFMDRAFGYHLPVPAAEEIAEYLMQETGVSQAVAEYLSRQLYDEGIRKNGRLSRKLGLQDVAQIAYYSAGRIKDNHLQDTELEVARQEAYLHLSAKFSPSKEKSEIDAIKKILEISQPFDFDVSLDPDLKTLNFGGIRIEIKPESKFADTIRELISGGDQREDNSTIEQENRKIDFSRALEKYLGDDEYFLTSMEKRILCLLARSHKYSPSDTVFLYGRSGEGKTTVSRVFLDIIGAKREEYALNKRSDLTMYRGSLKLTDDGIEKFVPRYWRHLGDKFVSPVYNEVDTSSLMQWLWPLFIGRAYRLGTEFPLTEAAEDGAIFERKVFGEEQTHILTGNMRKELPEIIHACLPAFYCMESSPEDTFFITDKIFQRRAAKELHRDLPPEFDNMSGQISQIYNNLRDALDQGRFVSQREVTRREIKRLSQLLFQAAAHHQDVDKTYNLLLEVFFARMWENFADRDLARQIIKDKFTGLSPPSPEELLAFMRDFPLDVPLLILYNDALPLAEIQEQILPDSPDLDQVFIPLSGFHSNRSIIGGMNRASAEESLNNKPGNLPWVIKRSHLSGRTQFCWVSGYLDLDKDVAPYLNEFFPTNWLQVDEIIDTDMKKKILSEVREYGAYGRLRQEYHQATGKDLPEDIGELEINNNGELEELVRFVLGFKPPNVVFRMTGVAGENIELNAADVDRFVIINMGEELSSQSMADYALKTFLAGAASSAISDKEINDLVQNSVSLAYELYQQQKEVGLYPHNRLHKVDVDVFVNELNRLRQEGALSEIAVKLLAYHILGKGLVLDNRPASERPKASAEIDYQQLFLQRLGLDEDLARVRYERKFVQEQDGVYFVISCVLDGNQVLSVKEKTKYSSYEQIDNYGRYRFNGSPKAQRLLAPLQAMLSTQLSVLLFRRNHVGGVLEGGPGGSKTTSLQDLALALGEFHYEEGMHRWIDLSSILGSLTIRGREVINTCLEKVGGHYQLPFLRVYSKTEDKADDGGFYVLDEGMVSKAAGKVIKWLVQMWQQKTWNPGTYQPGFQEQGELEKDPNACFFMTQNNHFSTKGRSALPLDVDMRCAKIRVDNYLSYPDALTLIDYYLEETVIPENIRSQLAYLHLEISKNHPQKENISPRDLIDIVTMIRTGRENPTEAELENLVYEALSINYVEGLLGPDQRAAVENILKKEEYFPGYSTPDYASVQINDHGHSNIEEKEVQHLKKSPTLMRLCRVIEKVITSTGRQVMLNETRGGMGVELLKLYSRLSGRRLTVYEGNPHITAKMILSGESLEFEQEYDSQGRRQTTGRSIVTHGMLGRTLVKEDELDSIPIEERVPEIVAITNMESIPTQELVKINQLIATRRIQMKDENGVICTYVIPDWVNFAPLTSNLAQLSGPCANRYRKVAVPDFTDAGEWHKVLSELYPNLTSQEAEMIMAAAFMSSIYTEENRFNLNNQFSMYYMEELALRIEMYKQQDGPEKFHDDPFWYVLKAIDYVYLQAMDPRDRDKFEREILVGTLLSERLEGLSREQISAYCYDTFKQMRLEDLEIKTTPYEITVSARDFNGEPLENDIVIQKAGEIINIITPAHVYKVKEADIPVCADPSGPKEFFEPKALSESKSVGVSRKVNEQGETTDLVLTLELAYSIGNQLVPMTEEAKSRCLPIDEVGIDEYLYPAEVLRQTISAILQAMQPVVTATGKVVRPRLILMPGETGSGKSTFPYWASKVFGLRVVRINPHKRMHVSELTESISLGEEVELTLGEFVKAFGKVKGQLVESAVPTTNNLLIFIDEANITRDVWYILDAIARGEKTFKVETNFGEVLEVEFDLQSVIINYNPPELYGGTGKHGNRYVMVTPVGSRCVKVYVSEPVAAYREKELDGMLENIYDRGEQHQERKAVLGDTRFPVPPGGYSEESVFLLPVRPLELGQKPRQIEEIKKQIEEDFPAVEEKEEEIPQDDKGEDPEEFIQRVQESFSFDPHAFALRVEEISGRLAVIEEPDERFWIFCRLLAELLHGLALERLDGELLSRVMAIAQDVSPELAKIIAMFDQLCRGEEISERQVKLLISRMDRLCRERMVYLEGLDADVFMGRAVVSLSPQKIARFIKFDRQVLKDLLGEELLNDIFPDDVIPDGIVLRRPPLGGCTGYYDSRDFIITEMDTQGQEEDIAAHEMGHVVTDTMVRLLKDKKISPELYNFKNQVLERLRRNVEIYSSFFPIIFSSDPIGYLESVLLRRIEQAAGSRDNIDNAYCAAAKNIFNALSLKLRNKPYKSYVVGQAREIIDELRTKPRAEIVAIGRELFKAPQTYFPEVDIGAYEKEESVSIAGVTHNIRLGEGLNVRPRIKIRRNRAAEKQIQIPNAPKEEKKFLSDSTPKETKELATKPIELKDPSGYQFLKFEKRMAPARGEDEQMDYEYSSDGQDLNTEVYQGKGQIGDTSRLFIKLVHDEEGSGEAMNILFMIDGSGSVTSDYELQEMLEAMLNRHATLFAKLCRVNPDLNVAIGVVGMGVEILFSFEQWKMCNSPQERDELVKDALRRMWHCSQAGGGGLNSEAILETVKTMDFPRVSGKLTRNMVVVYTDGEEGGGKDLQQEIRDVVENKDPTPETANRPRVDMVYMGANLKNYGAKLEENYPAFLHLSGDVDGDVCLDALFGVFNLQDEGRIEGNLGQHLDLEGEEKLRENNLKYYQGIKSPNLKKTMAEHLQVLGMASSSIGAEMAGNGADAHNFPILKDAGLLTESQGVEKTKDKVKEFSEGLRNLLVKVTKGRYKEDMDKSLADLVRDLLSLLRVHPEITFSVEQFRFIWGIKKYVYAFNASMDEFLVGNDLMEIICYMLVANLRELIPEFITVEKEGELKLSREEQSSVYISLVHAGEFMYPYLRDRLWAVILQAVPIDVLRPIIDPDEDKSISDDWIALNKAEEQLFGMNKYISDFLLEDYKEDKTARDIRQAKAAMRLKLKAYGGDDTQVSFHTDNPHLFNGLVMIYKMKWEDFCALMGMPGGYQAVHADPWGCYYKFSAKKEDQGQQGSSAVSMEMINNRSPNISSSKGKYEKDGEIESTQTFWSKVREGDLPGYFQPLAEVLARIYFRIFPRWRLNRYFAGLKSSPLTKAGCIRDINILMYFNKSIILGNEELGVLINFLAATAEYKYYPAVLDAINRLFKNNEELKPSLSQVRQLIDKGPVDNAYHDVYYEIIVELLERNPVLLPAVLADFIPILAREVKKYQDSLATIIYKSKFSSTEFALMFKKMSDFLEGAGEPEEAVAALHILEPALEYHRDFKADQTQFKSLLAMSFEVRLRLNQDSRELSHKAISWSMVNNPAGLIPLFMSEVDEGNYDDKMGYVENILDRVILERVPIYRYYTFDNQWWPLVLRECDDTLVMRVVNEHKRFVKQYLVSTNKEETPQEANMRKAAQAMMVKQQAYLLSKVIRAAKGDDGSEIVSEDIYKKYRRETTLALNFMWHSSELMRKEFNLPAVAKIRPDSPDFGALFMIYKLPWPKFRLFVDTTGFEEVHADPYGCYNEFYSSSPLELPEGKVSYKARVQNRIRTELLRRKLRRKVNELKDIKGSEDLNNILYGLNSIFLQGDKQLFNPNNFSEQVLIGGKEFKTLMNTFHNSGHLAEEYLFDSIINSGIRNNPELLALVFDYLEIAKDDPERFEYLDIIRSGRKRYRPGNMTKRQGDIICGVLKDAKDLEMQKQVCSILDEAKPSLDQDQMPAVFETFASAEDLYVILVLGDLISQAQANVSPEQFSIALEKLNSATDPEAFRIISRFMANCTRKQPVFIGDIFVFMETISDTRVITALVEIIYKVVIFEDEAGRRPSRGFRPISNDSPMMNIPLPRINRLFDFLAGLDNDIAVDHTTCVIAWFIIYNFQTIIDAEELKTFIALARWKTPAKEVFVKTIVNSLTRNPAELVPAFMKIANNHEDGVRLDKQLIDDILLGGIDSGLLYHRHVPLNYYSIVLNTVPDASVLRAIQWKSEKKKTDKKAYISDFIIERDGELPRDRDKRQAVAAMRLKLKCLWQNPPDVLFHEDNPELFSALFMVYKIGWEDWKKIIEGDSGGYPRIRMVHENPMKYYREFYELNENDGQGRSSSSAVKNEFDDIDSLKRIIDGARQTDKDKPGQEKEKELGEILKHLETVEYDFVVLSNIGHDIFWAVENGRGNIDQVYASLAQTNKDTVRQCIAMTISQLLNRLPDFNLREKDLGVLFNAWEAAVDATTRVAVRGAISKGFKKSPGLIADPQDLDKTLVCFDREVNDQEQAAIAELIANELRRNNELISRAMKHFTDKGVFIYGSKIREKVLLPLFKEGLRIHRYMDKWWPAAIVLRNIDPVALDTAIIKEGYDIMDYLDCLLKIEEEKAELAYYRTIAQAMRLKYNVYYIYRNSRFCEYDFLPDFMGHMPDNIPLDKNISVPRQKWLNGLFMIYKMEWEKFCDLMDKFSYEEVHADPYGCYQRFFEAEQTKGQQGSSAVGGIAFANLPIGVVPPQSLEQSSLNPMLNRNLSRMSLEQLRKECEQIKQMVSSGVAPSCERIMEYVSRAKACPQEDDLCAELIPAVILLLRLEEHSGEPTDPRLTRLLICPPAGN